MPASARVSAYFYLGRTEVSSGHIEQGLQLLEQAFQECPRDSNNMQTILRFLVPVCTACTVGHSHEHVVVWHDHGQHALLNMCTASGFTAR
jgi:hypothetical protein